MKLSSPAVARNADPIADGLARWLPSSGMILEVASGTGEHAVRFAQAFTGRDWQPSDPDADARASIQVWRDEAGLPNLLAPIMLDAAAADWPLDHAAAIVCINMVHISPWAATLGLFAGAGRLLEPGAPLILYGPFRRDGVPTAPSNEAFDGSLRERDARWGPRSVETIAAVSPHFALVETIDMPANNLMLLFRKIGAAA